MPPQKSLQSNMLLEHKINVAENYETIEKIGSGKFGAEIFKVRHRQGVSTEMYAMKSLQLNRMSRLHRKDLTNEIQALKTLDHPHILKGFEVYKFEDKVNVIMELIEGEDLYYRAPYSEREAALITGQLLSAVAHMHEHGIVHRDLKFENVILCNIPNQTVIKVIDFGQAKIFRSGKVARINEAGIGTLYTMAPQVVQGVYTAQADIWSVGVIAFMLMSSQKPFYDPSEKKMVDLIMRADYSMDGPIWETISEEGKHFVSSLLQLNPKDRLNCVEGLKHIWITNRLNHPDQKPSDSALTGIAHSLKLFKNTSTLKKLTLTVIAHKSSTTELLNLRKAFDAYDKSHNGTLDFAEFKLALRDSKYFVSEDEFEDIFRSIDIDGNGKILYTEFLAATLEARGQIEECRIAEAFRRIDTDGNGTISKAELQVLVGKDCTPEQIDEIFRNADTNGDGVISYDEFLDAFQEQNEALAKRLTFVDDMDESGLDLVGADHIIPGGRWDSE